MLGIGPITVYTYGVLLAAAYLLGLKFAMVRARARVWIRHGSSTSVSTSSSALSSAQSCFSSSPTGERFSTTLASF